MRLPTDRDELRSFLASLKVEHDHVNPDDIPGHWDAVRDAAKKKTEAA